MESQGKKTGAPKSVLPCDCDIRKTAKAPARQSSSSYRAFATVAGARINGEKREEEGDNAGYTPAIPTDGADRHS